MTPPAWKYLFEVFQSCSETALPGATNDLLMASDTGSMPVLVLLHLSAAFHTRDQSILLPRLEHLIRLRRTAQDWFKSHWSDRFQMFLPPDGFSVASHRAQV